MFIKSKFDRNYLKLIYQTMCGRNWQSQFGGHQCGHRSAEFNGEATAWIYF